MLVYITATVLTMALCAWLVPERKLSKAGVSPEADPAERGAYRRKRVLTCVICMLPLLAVMSCRWSLGVDMWHTYMPGYLAIKSETVPLTEEEEKILQKSAQLRAWWNRNGGDALETNQQITVEQAYRTFRWDYPHTGKGFQIFERILAFFRADVQWFYFATSLCVIGLVFASIWLQSTRPMWAGLFFVITANFFVALNVIAQYMAVAMCVFACTFAEKRKPFWFFLLVGLAITFHTSAFVFLPVYFLPKIRVKPLWCAVAVAVSLVVSQFAYPVLEQIVRWIAPQYVSYIRGSIESGFEWIFFAINCAVFALSTWYYKKGKDLPYYRLWYNINVLAMIALAFSGVVPWMKRVNYYFAAPHFLLIPMALGLEENKKRRIALHAVTVLLFCTEIYVAIVLQNKHATLPYRAFFQGDRVEMMQEMFSWIR